MRINKLASVTTSLASIGSARGCGGTTLALSEVTDTMTCTGSTIPSGSAWQCARCGAVGRHYLTCPILQLPQGYRVGKDPALSVPVNASPGGQVTDNLSRTPN
jgi:hypothetical protein